MIGVALSLGVFINSIDYCPGSGFCMYEGNNASQEKVCLISDRNNQRINLNNYDECDNDEIKSAKIVDIKAGTALRVYDSPTASTEDDWAELIIKKDIKEVVISSFEKSYESEGIKLIYHRNNFLDGKISFIEVSRVDLASDEGQGIASIDMYEGNYVQQNLVCSVQDEDDLLIKFKQHKW